MSYFGDDDPHVFFSIGMFDEPQDKNEKVALPKEGFVELPEEWNPGGSLPHLPRAFFGD